MTLGERLKAKREESGLSKREAAALLGCSPNNYRFWELGVVLPGSDRLEGIREWLGLDAATLLAELSEATRT